MSDPLNVPGVYIEEISGGARAITPLPTSVTAFVGRAERGPVETPVPISSFNEFERVFGGLWAKSALGFAVRDFFANGGSTAIVVRLYRPGRARSKATLTLGTLVLEAASQGAWGNHLRARVAHQAAPRFDLHVVDAATGVAEVHHDLVVGPASNPRNVRSVLEAQSALVRVTSVGPRRPAATTADVSVSTAGKGSDGLALNHSSFTAGGPASSQGLYALNRADLVNVLVIPPHRADGGVHPAVVRVAASYCEGRRAVLILDGPLGWLAANDVVASFRKGFATELGTTSANAAVYFPRVREANPLKGGQVETFAVAGVVAGVIARTDATRGVWKAPAGVEATVNGVAGLAPSLGDADIGLLNPIGVNALRPGSTVPAAAPRVWGARTLQGFDGSTSEWRYLPVRRFALHVEESVQRGLTWAVFESNAESLWAQIRLVVGAFLDGLFRQGAFPGSAPSDAYFVRCDATTTTLQDIDRGIVNVEIGIAPLKPAEFIIIHVQQVAQAG